ncbi:zf-HC2 domain-containing protein [Phaeovulum sp.]|uniref:zf-HC2 domain-containing protein n=1 Tax=Phaeovulum sp. TaxID=2934796 RepID=UPI0035688833
MLSCKEVAQRASAMIDGELGAWQMLQMRMHLAMCKGCARFVSQLRTTRDLAEAAMAADASQEAVDASVSAILSRLNDGKPQSG